MNSAELKEWANLCTLLQGVLNDPGAHRLDVDLLKAIAKALDDAWKVPSPKTPKPHTVTLLDLIEAMHHRHDPSGNTQRLAVMLKECYDTAAGR